MILGIVKGTVVATRKMPELVGYKFLLVEPVFGSKGYHRGGRQHRRGCRRDGSGHHRRDHPAWFTIRRPLMLSSWASWTILPP